MQVKYVQGDATEPQGDNIALLVHCCNNIGAWGAGFVLALSKRWGLPEAAYRDWAGGRSKSIYPPFELGQVQVVQVEKNIFVANMIGQAGVGSGPQGAPPVRYDAIAKALDEVCRMAEAIEEACGNTCEVHCPKFGAGLAGGDWNKIEQLLIDHLVAKGVMVTAYGLPPAPSAPAQAHLKMPTIKLGPRPAAKPRKSFYKARKPRKAKA